MFVWLGAYGRGACPVRGANLDISVVSVFVLLGCYAQEGAGLGGSGAL